MKSLISIKFIVDDSTGIRSAVSLEGALSRFFASRDLFLFKSGDYGNTKLLNVTPNKKDPVFRMMQLCFILDSSIYTSTSSFVHDLDKLFESGGITAKRLTTNTPELVILLTKSLWATEEEVKKEEPAAPTLSTRFLHRLMEKSEDEETLGKDKAKLKEKRMSERYERMLKSLQKDMHLPRAL